MFFRKFQKIVLNTTAGRAFFSRFQNDCCKHDSTEGVFRQVLKKFSMSWILNWGGQEGGINGLRNMVSTAGIHTQGARKMPWQDLRTAREGGNGFDLRFGACAVAVSLGVGRLWPRNPLTGSACSVALIPRVLRLDCDATRSGLPVSLCGRQRDVRVLAAKRPGRHKNRAPALLPWKYFVRLTR